MTPYAQKLVWVLVLTVLLLFLFPLQWGSFTQTHGPTTALRALIAIQCLFATMALLVSFAISVIALFLAQEEVFTAPETSSSTCIQLRC